MCAVLCVKFKRFTKYFMTKQLSKIYLLLSSKMKRKLVYLSFLLFLSVIFEMISLGALIPILAYITNSNKNFTLNGGQIFNIKSLNLSNSEIIILLMLLLFLMYFLKSIYLLYTSWKQSDFSVGLPEELSNALFLGYLTQPYSFHLKRNSAHLIANLQTEISQFSSVIQSAITVIVEFSIVFGLSISLFIIEPFGGFVVACVLLVANLTFSFFTKKRLKEWGQKRQHLDSIINQYLIQGLSGVKEVKLLNRESFFSEQYKKEYHSKSKIYIKQLTLMQFPKLYMELLAVLALSVLVVTMVIQNKAINDLLPTIGVFMAGAFRILPSLNKIISSIQNIKFSIPVIDMLFDEYNLIQQNSSKKNSEIAINFSNQIIINDLTFNYENSQINAISNINLTVNKGMTIGIIGRSGSGKSTFVDLLLGLLTPKSGEIIVDSINVNKNIKSWQKKIGYVPQNIYLTDDTLSNNIAFGLRSDQINYDKVNQVIKDAQLQELVNSLPNGINTNVGENGISISGGQRQRIGIARALYNDPELLVLDEATSALDTKTEQEIMNTVNSYKGKKTIIIVAHRLSTIENCDQVLTFDQGYLIDIKHNLN
jgi:ABC-type multidrug transport system fused ATPase/permease subunit